MRGHANSNRILKQHPLASFTSWKIGGVAEYFFQPRDLSDLSTLLQNWKDEPITLLGAATNVLICDSGIKGLVIYLRDTLTDLQKLSNDILYLEAGVSLTTLVQKCAGLGMLEASFMAGIPGTVGGALKMNAGAYGNNIWQYVQSVDTIDRRGKFKTRDAKEFIAGYRYTEGLAQNEWFVAARLKFNPGDIVIAKNQVQNYINRRKKSQPLNLPSCGSVFRNPPGGYAAKLIEASGLKGRQIGGAKVSEKHANFIVNYAGATAADVESLMQEIILTVTKNSGITLIPEVHILPVK